MAQVFYRITGGAPLEFCLSFKARWKSKMAEFGAYSTAKGGEGFTEMFGYFGSVIFAHGAKIPDGFVAMKRRTNDGQIAYVPAKRTAAGKIIKAEFDALGRFPMSDEFCHHFSIPTSLSYRKQGEGHGHMALHSGGFSTAQVLWVNDDFWVILPDIAEVIAEKAAKGWDCDPSQFCPPIGIERSSKARYELAIAAAKVLEEEGKANG
jgi:hypothetical protein